MSVTENAAPLFATSVPNVTQYSHQFSIRLISLLINGISVVVQTFLGHSIGTIILTLFLLLFPVTSIAFWLKELVIALTILNLTILLLVAALRAGSYL